LDSRGGTIEQLNWIETHRNSSAQPLLRIAPALTSSSARRCRPADP